MLMQVINMLTTILSTLFINNNYSFKVNQLIQFWKMSHLDAVVWLATFLTVVIFSIDIGLLIGIVLSLACIFIRGLKPYTCLLGTIRKTDLYLDITRYKAVRNCFFFFFNAFIKTIVFRKLI